MSELVPASVVVEGSENTLVVPRIKPARETPAVIHLLNRRYDGERDEMIPQEGLSVRLRRDLYDGRRFRKATMFAPQVGPRKLEFDLDDTYASIQIPQLDLWGIIELDD